MTEGIILKAISGLYHVETEEGPIECRARGRFRKEKITPLVGDRAEISMLDPGQGVLEQILPRKNEFVRPAIANLDQLVVVVSLAIPVTDPFLMDRITAIAEYKNVDCVICINKTDLNSGDELWNIYSAAGFPVIRTSTVTGEGIDLLGKAIEGKVSAFTGNSGVGKSSILNSLEPDFNIKVGEVSDKLGRGRHTTRHIELFKLNSGAIVADTPGFSSFDTGRMDLVNKEDLQYAFIDFKDYIGRCKYVGCSHTKEEGCAVLKAVEGGEIQATRHKSYVRLYEKAKEIKQWELRK